MNHTPGPWKLNWRIAGGGQHSEYPVLHYVCIEGGEYGDDPQIQPLRLTGYIRKPDAFLLAAAPDLLAACKEALKDHQEFSTQYQTPALVKLLRDTIAKAEGL